MMLNVFDWMSSAEKGSVVAGDGVANVNEAIAKAAAHIGRIGGGELVFPPGRYKIGKQDRKVFYGAPPDNYYAYQYRPTCRILNCAKPVRIIGNGAAFIADRSLRYGTFDVKTGLPYASVAPFYDFRFVANAYRGMIHVEGCENVFIEGFDLNGNAANIVLGGEWGDSQRQLEATGLWLRGNRIVRVRNIYSHHHALDGMQVINAGLTRKSGSRPHTFEGVVCRHNGRLGAAITGGIGMKFKNCDFSQQGRVTNTKTGLLIATAPGAGVDIEPEASIVRNVTFTNCTFKANNRGPGVTSASGDSADVLFEHCLFTGEASKFPAVSACVGAHPRFTYRDCIFAGYTNFAFSATTSDADANLFVRCRFTNDNSYAETGALNLTQSVWTEAIKTRFTDCVIDTGPTLLPNNYMVANGPVWTNCKFLTRNPGENALSGTFRGDNKITAAGKVILGPGARVVGRLTINGAQLVLKEQ